MTRSIVIVIAIAACGTHGRERAVDATSASSDAAAVDANNMDSANADAAPDQTVLVASDVDHCAINATDVFCFSATSGVIWQQSKTGGPQTTIAQAANVRFMAADASYVIAVTYLSASAIVQPYRVPVAGGQLAAVANALDTDLWVNPIVMLDPKFYFVAGSSAPTIYQMDVSQTSNSWTSIDTIDHAYLLSTDQTALVYVKNAHVEPSSFTLPLGFTPWGVGADQDSYYLSGNLNTTTSVNEVIKVSRADGTAVTLASAPSTGISWDGMFVGTTSVYWYTASGLSRVNKLGGSIETLASDGFPADVMLDDQYVWWISAGRKLYRKTQ